MRRRESRSRGSAALEFAIVLPVLLLLLGGLVDYGWYFVVGIAANDAAREAARTATTYAGPCPNEAGILAGEAAGRRNLTPLGVDRYATVAGRCDYLPGETEPSLTFDVDVRFPRPIGMSIVPMPAADGMPGSYTTVHAHVVMRGVP